MINVYICIKIGLFVTLLKIVLIWSSNIFYLGPFEHRFQTRYIVAANAFLAIVTVALLNW